MSRPPAALAGRALMITGGARRLGAAMAHTVAAAGAEVVIHYHRAAAEAAALAEEITGRYGVAAVTIAADLSEPARCDYLMDQALVLTNGRLDGIINNPSLYPESQLQSVTAAEIENSMRLHAFAPLALARRLPRRPGQRSDVINILDARITMYDRDHAAYHLGKRMLGTLTSMLALELAPEVRVNAVAPGAVLQMEHEEPAALQRLAAFNPLQRVGTPKGVAAAVLFLLTTDFITGQTLYYDGGYHLKAATYG